jgi:hypothetical protein
LFELGFKPFQQRECICGCSSKSADNIAFADPADFFRVSLHDSLAERDLAVTGNDHLFAFTNSYEGCAVHDGG